MTRSNEWGETLEETVDRSSQQKGLLIYSMEPGERVEIAINGEMNEGIALGQSRTITAECVEPRSARLAVLEDSCIEDSWTSTEICLGSYVFELSGVSVVRGGLLRGTISLKQGVVVDFDAQHFTASEPIYLLAEYASLHLQERRIF